VKVHHASWCKDLIDGDAGTPIAMRRGKTALRNILPQYSIARTLRCGCVCGHRASFVTSTLLVCSTQRHQPKQLPHDRLSPFDPRFWNPEH
jgi:hypothetical protein